LADAENTAPAVSAAFVSPAPVASALDEARLDVRLAGYCILCDRIVERLEDGTCPKGHPADGITGRIVLIDDDPVPILPAFNWGAFLLPFLWGPAHGQWVGAVFLPIWLFADSILSSAGRGGVPTLVAAVVVAALTLLFEWYFAKRANGLAFRRVIDTQSAEQFARSERLWAIAAIPMVIGLIAWAAWFRIAVAPTLGAG
jgi:hypothetical protein